MLTSYRIGYIMVLPNGKGGEKLTLKDARKNIGMTIKELADAVGVSPAAICRYENGQRIPKQQIAKRLGEKLGIAWYEIIDDQKAS